MSGLLLRNDVNVPCSCRGDTKNIRKGTKLLATPKRGRIGFASKPHFCSTSLKFTLWFQQRILVGNGTPFSQNLARNTGPVWFSPGLTSIDLGVSAFTIQTAFQNIVGCAGGQQPDLSCRSDATDPQAIDKTWESSNDFTLFRIHLQPGSDCNSTEILPNKIKLKKDSEIERCPRRDLPELVKPVVERSDVQVKVESRSEYEHDCLTRELPGTSVVKETSMIAETTRAPDQLQDTESELLGASSWVKIERYQKVVVFVQEAMEKSDTAATPGHPRSQNKSLVPDSDHQLPSYLSLIFTF
ncbi:hypothetical protein EDB19DRAFT_1972276 [Suillus lakei]|nr:hypothetical protein EDB19DRAFT_1972276 [Suillus lakei]